MRKYLLHVLIISFVFLLMPVVNVFALQTRGIQVLIKDKHGKQVGMYKGSHALVIGIDNYTKGWSRLGNAVKDADAIAKELKKQGFEVTLKKDLTGTALRGELRKFFVIKGENPEARLLLWFSGHCRYDTIVCRGSKRPSSNFSPFFDLTYPTAFFPVYTGAGYSKTVYLAFAPLVSNAIFFEINRPVRR